MSKLNCVTEFYISFLSFFNSDFRLFWELRSLNTEKILKVKHSFSFISDLSDFSISHSLKISELMIQFSELSDSWEQCTLRVVYRYSSQSLSVSFLLSDSHCALIFLWELHFFLNFFSRSVIIQSVFSFWENHLNSDLSLWWIWQSSL